MSRERKPRVLVVEHMRAMVQRLAIRDDFRPPRPVYLTAAEHKTSGIWKRPRRPEEMTENKPEAWAELYAVMGDVVQHAMRVQEIARQQYHAALAATQADGPAPQEPVYPEPGSSIPDWPGYVVGTCQHRIAESEWRAGYRACERCPASTVPGVGHPYTHPDGTYTR